MHPTRMGVVASVRVGLRIVCAFILTMPLKVSSQTDGVVVVVCYVCKCYEAVYAKGTFFIFITFLEIVPKEISSVEAASFFCAGITTYTPLKRYKAGPNTRLGVIGIG